MEVLEAVNASVGDSFEGGVTTVHSERLGGDTALHIVAKWGDAEAISVLVEAGAIVDKPGEDGNTPLHYAAMIGHIEAAKRLVQLGAIATRDRYGHLPSQSAATNSELQNYLVQNGF